MPSIAEWDSYYHKCIETSNGLRTSIQKAANSNDLTKIDTIMATFSRNVSKLDTDLKTMASDSAKYKLNDRELGKRGKQLEGLVRDKNSIDINLKQKRQTILNPKSSLLTKSNGQMAAPAEFANKTNTELKQMQEQVMKQQDVVLSDISDGVERLNQMSLSINNEIDLHVRLLDNLDNDIESANNRVQQESVRTKVVTKKSKMCVYYMLIGLGIIVLSVLIWITFF
ncbi:hypothetical protein WA158_002923 [Blastocystis sp. Blastoise]